MNDFDAVREAAEEVAKRNLQNTPRYDKHSGQRVANPYNYNSLNPHTRRQQRWARNAGAFAGGVGGGYAALKGKHIDALIGVLRTSAKHSGKISDKIHPKVVRGVSFANEYSMHPQVRLGIAATGAVAGGATGLKAERMRQARGTTTKKPVSKSQLPDGSYKRTVKMTSHERAELANRIRWNKDTSIRRGDISGRGARVQRGLSETHYGAGIEHHLEAAASAKSRPSQVHRNIRYGTSIRPGMEAAIDDKLDPKHVGGLRHAVVFHHLNLNSEEAVAASSVHHKALAGGRAHIVLNAADHDADGRGAGDPEFRNVINHEMVHASTHHHSPRRFVNDKGEVDSRGGMGEEARADALSHEGPGIYRRAGAVGNSTGRHVMGRLGAALHHAGVKFPDDVTAEDFRQSARANAHYNRVHRKVRYKTSGVGGLADDAVKTAALHPGKYVIGAAATGAVAHHEWKKHHMNSADAAVAKARDYEESKHSRGHDGRFTPMNSSGMPQHVPVVDRDGKETGWRYTRVASDKKMFNRVYDTRSNILAGYNAYGGAAYGALGGGFGALAAGHRKVAPELHGKLAAAGALAGGAAGAVGAYKGTKAFMARPAHKDKIQGKFDRQDFYAREKVGKAATRNPTPPGGTARGAVAGGYLGGVGGVLGAAAGKNPERLSDLRAAYHNHAHARAVHRMASYKTKETAPVKRTMRGKYGTYEDLSPRAQKVVRTAHKLKQVAATDKEFQAAAPGIGGLAGATVGAAAIGGLAHHNRTKWKAAHPGYRR